MAAGAIKRCESLQLINLNLYVLSGNFSNVEKESLFAPACAISLFVLLLILSWDSFFFMFSHTCNIHLEMEMMEMMGNIENLMSGDFRS